MKGSLLRFMTTRCSGYAPEQLAENRLPRQRPVKLVEVRDLQRWPLIHKGSCTSLVSVWLHCTSLQFVAGSFKRTIYTAVARLLDHVCDNATRQRQRCLGRRMTRSICD